MPYYVISIIVSATSRLDARSLLAVSVSVCCSTILFPCMNSKDDPWGIGTSLISLILSDPTPTLAFSTNNLSPTSTGNSLAKLYATFNVAATVSVDES